MRTVSTRWFSAGKKLKGKMVKIASQEGLDFCHPDGLQPHGPPPEQGRKQKKKP